MGTIEIATKRDAQRLRCPRNHVVQPTNKHFWCPSCARHWDPDVESEFSRVRDAESGEWVERAQLRFSGAARERVPG